MADPVLEPFAPRGVLANTHVQTLMNSSLLRRLVVRRRAAGLLHQSEQWILDGGDGIRLQGFYNAQQDSRRGMVILLHGWEGSSVSNYILGTANRLFREGYEVFRLNFRDHGATHHLNPGIFHSRRLDEVVNSVAEICKRIATRPVFIAGYSLGGNFALRVARQAPKNNIPLSRVVTICPAINPDHVLHALENGPAVYHRYFVRKWQRSLRKKEQCFPDLYDFSDWFKLRGLREQTEYLVDKFTDYGSLENYLNGYSVAGDRLQDLKVPASILAAMDDPVIPVTDIRSLTKTDALEIVLTRYGGHCGYLKDWRFDSWAEDFILDRCQVDPSNLPVSK